MGLRVRIVGADSFGARSMATVVHADGAKIVIDPGVSYAPRRYGLPPHPRELERVEEIRERIIEELEDADYVVITHYHYDHYMREDEYAALMSGKVLFVKHPRSAINVSQRIRAHRFLVQNRVSEYARRLEYADGRSFELEGFRLSFSPPVPHGAPGSRLGYVIMVAVECCGEVFVHASDVQGPMSGEALDWIIAQHPSLVYISGPPTYFAGYKVPREQVEKGLEGLKRLAATTQALIVADHHFARDLRYPSLLRELRRESGATIVSAADYMGVEYEPLEALRRELWRGEDSAEEASRSH